MYLPAKDTLSVSVRFAAARRGARASLRSRFDRLGFSAEAPLPFSFSLLRSRSAMRAYAAFYPSFLPPLPPRSGGATSPSDCSPSLSISSHPRYLAATVFVSSISVPCLRTHFCAFPSFVHLHLSLSLSASILFPWARAGSLVSTIAHSFPLL